MPALSAVSEDIAMLEPLIGLAVALALGVYLVVTLIRPERF
ncbi:MAG: K(+)-transporting ATPase subunit F [Rhizobiaceae bacterium]